jgi:hypothetical protein
MPTTPMGLDKRALDLLAAWRDCLRWDEGFLELIRQFVPWFEAEGIDYLFSEAVAVLLHGGSSNSQDAAMLLTPAGWQRVRERGGERFEASDFGESRSLSVVGLGYASRVSLRESLAGLGVTGCGVRVASLPFLITGLMNRMGPSERRTIVSLIRANGLDDAFRLSLPAHRRATYRELLAEARRQKA